MHRRFGRYFTAAQRLHLTNTQQSFYSTQFVNQQERPEGGHSLVYTENAWLFFAVSVPLTVFTITIWYTWSHFRMILDIFNRRRERQTAGFTERIRMMGLLKNRRELPR